MTRFLLICLGGAVGTGARYLLSGWVLQVFGTSFPYGTLAVNTIGSFLLAIIMYLGIEATTLPPTLRLVLGTGVMGGFTTYSTFSYETMKYLQDGAWAVAVTNIVVSVIGCLAACLSGWAAARWLVGP
ncbi:MAG: fluoride efflux transporter CrcB [Deltaproteobacteria bacterium]|nr:fluoride efflux transporter CrcB [Deltaproteobacteria bacterium]